MKETLQGFCEEALKVLGEEGRIVFLSPNYGVITYRGAEFSLHGPAIRGWKNLNRGLIALDLPNFKKRVDRRWPVAVS